MDSSFRSNNTYYEKAFAAKGYNIEKFNENELQFHYGDVTYQDFQRYYKPNGWACRKITAIPRALLTGIGLTVLHIARLIFVDIPKTICGDTLAIRRGVFHITRDLQIGLGCLVTLFNDCRGQFLIQEGQLQKKCYDELEKKLASQRKIRTPPKRPKPQNNDVGKSMSGCTLKGTFISDAWGQITLKKFKEANQTERNTWINQQLWVNGNCLENSD
jgi:hypothetical protein